MPNVRTWPNAVNEMSVSARRVSQARWPPSGGNCEFWAVEEELEGETVTVAEGARLLAWLLLLLLLRRWKCFGENRWAFLEDGS